MRPEHRPRRSRCPKFAAISKRAAVTSLPITINELETNNWAGTNWIFKGTFQKVLNNTAFRFRLLLRQNVAHFKNILNELKRVSSLFVRSYYHLK